MPIRIRPVALGGVSVSTSWAGVRARCDQLARAATGTVWRAWDLRHGRYCAADSSAGGTAGTRCGSRGSRAYGGTRTCYPVHLVADARVLVASPLADGGSLRGMLDEYGPLARPRAPGSDLLDELPDGLAHLHAAGVVHRGVGPAAAAGRDVHPGAAAVGWLVRARRQRRRGRGRPGSASGEVAAGCCATARHPGGCAVMRRCARPSPRNRPPRGRPGGAAGPSRADPPRTLAGDRVVLPRPAAGSPAPGGPPRDPSSRPHPPRRPPPARGAPAATPAPR